MNWLNRFFNSKPGEQDLPSPSTGFVDMEGQPVPLSVERQDVRMARELIRTAAKRTTQSFGIPPHWMSYEVVTIADDEKAYFQLQISLRVWDEQLWAQSSAFEWQAMKCIREDNANVARAVRAVLWRILPDAGCPHDELAGGQAWLPDAVKERAAAYEKLRISLASSSVGSAVVKPQLAVLAAMMDKSEQTAPTSTGFGETQPMSHSGYGSSEFQVTGFPATQPVALTEELSSTLGKKV